jgi:hypothetical protein
LSVAHGQHGATALDKQQMERAGLWLGRRIAGIAAANQEGGYPWSISLPVEAIPALLPPLART